MKKRLTLLVIFIVGAMLSSSCSKEDDEYLLTVKVTVNDTASVQNALVRIYAPVEPTNIDAILFTDENGETEAFEVDNKAIVEIFAGKGSFKGCGFAEITRGPQTVIIDMKPGSNTQNGCSSTP